MSTVPVVKIGSSRYRDYLVSLSPTNYWRTGEASGTVMAAVVGSAGTYVNAPTLGVAGLLTGDPDTSVTLNGTTQYGTVPHAASLNYGDVFTLLAWVKNVSGVGSNECLINKGTGTGSLYVTAGNYVTLDKGATARLVVSTVAFSAGSAHMLCATKNGADVHLYIDGVDVTGTVTNATMADTTSPLTLGSEQSANPWLGTIDEPAIWNRALTAAEIAKLYRLGLDGAHTSEIANQSLRLSQNTLDLTLVAPALVPALGAAVTVSTPAWSGTVANVETESDERGTILFARVTASNTAAAGASAAPFGLSDAPNNSTTFGYRNLVVTKTRMSTGDESRVTLECFEEGLGPGQTVALTSAVHGLSAVDYTIDEMYVAWLKPGTATYRLFLGDPLVTMSVWANSAEAGLFPIDRTKITDGEVTTPKLAANSVTASKIDVSAIVGLQNLVPHPGGESATVNGQTTLQGWTLTATAMRLATLQRSGNVSFQSVATAGTAYNAAVTGYLPVAGGRRYTASVWLSGYATNAATAGGTLQVSWYDAAQALISSSALTRVVVGTSTTYVQSTGTVVAPATAVWARVLAIASATVTTADRIYWDDFGLYLADQNVDHAAGSVLINSAGITVTNGKLTVTNAGATVIIDGTSNMFKIQATGTHSVTEATGAGGSASTTTTLGALGTVSVVPAALHQISLTGTGVLSSRYEGRHLLYAANAFSAATSGGAVTQRIVGVSHTVMGWVNLDGTPSGSVTVSIGVVNASGASTTGDSRYYVLKEASL